MNKLFEKLSIYKEMHRPDLFEKEMNNVPKASQKNVRALFTDPLLDIDEAIMEAQDLMCEEKDEEALEILDEKVALLEERNPVHEDAYFCYCSIQNEAEEFLFEYLEKTGRQLMRPQENYGLLYQTHGALLLLMDRVQEAKESFEISLRWNPYDLETRMFVIELMKLENRLESFFFENKKLLQIAIRPKCIAIIYQNFAYYYLQKKEYKNALYSMMMAADYGMELDDYAFDLIDKIDLGQDKNFMPRFEDINSYFISEGIPVPPDDNLYEFLLEQAMKYQSEDLMLSMIYLNTLDSIKNSLEHESEEEIKIRRKYNRQISNEIRKMQDIPYSYPKDMLVKQLSLTKIYVPFKLDIEDPGEFECELVQNESGEVFVPIYLFPSKIPQSQKNKFDIRLVPFEFCIETMAQWEELDGVVLHPYSEDSLEILREDFMG